MFLSIYRAKTNKREIQTRRKCFERTKTTVLGHIHLIIFMCTGTVKSDCQNAGFGRCFTRRRCPGREIYGTLLVGVETVRVRFRKCSIREKSYDEFSAFLTPPVKNEEKKTPVFSTLRNKILIANGRKTNDSGGTV